MLMKILNLNKVSNHKIINMRYPPPPPPCGQTDGWMEGQTLVKTLPSLVLRTRVVMTKYSIDIKGNLHFSQIWHSETKSLTVLQMLKLIKIVELFNDFLFLI